MEDKVNGWRISHNGDNSRGSSRDAGVPSSLLPNVLHRLGLTPEQALSELSFDDLVAKLKSDDWNGGSDAERPFTVQEQVQGYVPLEQAFYEYGDAISSHGEKLTARRGPQRGWWVAIATAALLFFLLGGGVATWVMPARTQVISASPVQARPFPFWDAKYNWIAENYIATALHLTPEQITAQLQAGKSLTEIAAAQGVSASELQIIELKAFQHMFDVAVKSGGTSQQDADEWMQQLQHTPPLLDKMTIGLFLANPPPVPTPAPH